MVFIYIASTFSVILALLSGYFNIKEKYSARLVAKTCASFLFVASAITASFITGSMALYVVLIITALILGLLGDIFLCSKGLTNKKGTNVFSALGLFTFLAGHLVYITAFFISVNKFNALTLLTVPIIPLLLLIVYASKKITVAKFKVPFLFIYSFVLGLMLSSSLNFYLQTESTLGILVAVAGVLFSVSDSIIVLREFGNPKFHKPLVYAVLLTYYAAQVLFGYTIVLLA